MEQVVSLDGEQFGPVLLQNMLGELADTSGFFQAARADATSETYSQFFEWQNRAISGSYKILYTFGVADSKPVEFRGSSLEDLRAVPLTAKRQAGHQLDQLQNGWEPDDSKPMNTVGRGAKEIRIRDEAGAFRVLYVAKFADAI
jgi:hypothetical protein